MEKLRLELQKYTKDELIYYLTQIESFLPKHLNIKMCIHEKKLKDISNLIDRNLSESKKLSNLHSIGQINNLEYIVKMAELHKQWENLEKRQDKLSRILYERREGSI